MNYSTMAEPAIGGGGWNAVSGPDDFLETESTFLGRDLASENGEAR
jgi:hypothetical protein